MKYLYYSLFVVFIVSCKKDVSNNSVLTDAEVITVKSALIEAFKYTPDAAPIISVHRGGKSIKNYPENCLETLQYVNDSITAIYEIDVAKTKDGVLVLMHDKSLNRTTSGEGLLSNYTYKELYDVVLVDDFGTSTTFRIPVLKDVLLWAKTNHVVLTLDIKRGVPLSDVVKMIRDLEAEAISIIITYDLEQAQKAHKLAPELLLSVTARNEKELDWLLHSNIPTENMLAFTGTRLSSKAFYQKVHQYGIKTILGTLGNLDKQAEAKGDDLYITWKENGIDVFATDRPFAAANALQIKN